MVLGTTGGSAVRRGVRRQPLTKGFSRLCELQCEGAASGELLEQPGHLVVPAAQQALSVDGLDHVTHTDELDVVDHAALLNALWGKELSAPVAPPLGPTVRG